MWLFAISKNNAIVKFDNMEHKMQSKYGANCCFKEKQE